MPRQPRSRSGRTLALALVLLGISGLGLAQDHGRHCAGKPHGAPAGHGQTAFAGARANGGICVGGDLIVDGGLEDTDPVTLANPNWGTSSTQFGTPLCSLLVCGDFGTAAPRNGTFWAWFGGADGSMPETATLSQAVVFPSGASVTLHFYLWIGFVSDPFTDTLVVQVDGVTQRTFIEPAVAEAGYTLRSIDLSAFADGSSHTINFLYTQAAGANVDADSDFSVDDISLDVVCPNALTATPVSLQVDPLLPGLQVSGNGVLELNENATLDPGWMNPGMADFALTGSVNNLTGPGVALSFTLVDDTADYGIVTAGTSKDCLTGTPNCYVINVAGVRSDQPTHLDLTIDEAVVPVGLTLVNDTVLKTWTLHVGDSFSDATADGPSAPYYPSIETIFHKGVTAGCGDGTVFCPDANVLRQEMAVFLIKAAQDPIPACAGLFNDVPCDSIYAPFIEELSTLGVTAGCQSNPPFNPPVYCPEANVLRQEMAVFLIKTVGQTTDPCVGLFNDVPCDSIYAPYIEKLSTLGITAGCQADPPFNPPVYCPDADVLRQEMAVFLTRTFGLVLYGP